MKANKFHAPWKRKEEAVVGGGWKYIIENAEGEPIVVAYQSADNYKQLSKLVTAAPEMYTLLENMKDIHFSPSGINAVTGEWFAQEAIRILKEIGNAQI